MNVVNTAGIQALPLSVGQRLYLALRRPLEVAAALLLGLVSLPFLAVFTVAIVMESSGGPFFIQERVGRGGRRFRLYKLRTMYTTAPPYSYKISSYHPHVTRLGRFLRRSGLDEIPQFWNVVKGDLSLIGPRPELAFIVADYQDWQHDRHAVRPGITGWWQVNNRTEQPMHEALSYDFHYLANLGPGLDARILWRTVMVIVQGSHESLRAARERRARASGKSRVAPTVDTLETVGQVAADQFDAT
jgi:lipopolysaccharide/colanic/teichoic acid biosynthesis glycosyltransferase